MKNSLGLMLKMHLTVLIFAVLGCRKNASQGPLNQISPTFKGRIQINVDLSNYIEEIGEISDLQALDETILFLGKDLHGQSAFVGQLNKYGNVVKVFRDARLEISCINGSVLGGKNISQDIGVVYFLSETNIDSIVRTVDIPQLKRVNSIAKLSTNKYACVGEPSDFAKSRQYIILDIDRRSGIPTISVESDTSVDTSYVTGLKVVSSTNGNLLFFYLHKDDLVSMDVDRGISPGRSRFLSIGNPFFLGGREIGASKLDSNVVTWKNGNPGITNNFITLEWVQPSTASAIHVTPSSQFTSNFIGDFFNLSGKYYSVGYTDGYDGQDGSVAGNAMVCAFNGLKPIQSTTFGDPSYLQCFNSGAFFKGYLWLAGYTERRYKLGTLPTWYTNTAASKPYIVAIDTADLNH